MNKILPGISGGYPIGIRTLDFMQEAVRDTFIASCTPFVPETGAFIISGVEVTGNDYTAGWLFAKGEIYRVAAGTFTLGIGGVAGFVVNIAYSPLDPGIFKNGSSNDFRQIRTAEIVDINGLPSGDVLAALAGIESYWSLVASKHNHDDRYYTEAQVDAILAGLVTNAAWTLQDTTTSDVSPQNGFQAYYKVIGKTMFYQYFLSYQQLSDVSSFYITLPSGFVPKAGRLQQGIALLGYAGSPGGQRFVKVEIANNGRIIHRSSLGGGSDVPFSTLANSNPQIEGSLTFEIQ